MKYLCAVLVIVLAGLAVWGFLTHRGDTQVAIALRAEIASLEAAHATQDSAWAQERARLQSDRERLVREGARLAQRVTIARDSARQALGALAAYLAMRGDTTDIMTPVENAFQACDQELANLGQQIGNCELRVTLADNQAAANLRLAGQYQSAWRDAEDRARPNWIRDAWRGAKVWAPLAALLAALAILD